MGNKIFGGVVFLLWVSTMTWLMTAKILPPFFSGDPPPQNIADQEMPVAWGIELNGKQCGVAVTQTVEGASGTREIHSLAMLERIPLPEIAPPWMLSLVQNIGEIKLQMRTRTTLDALKNLAGLETRIHLNNLPSVVRMKGWVREGRLHLQVRTGEFVHQMTYPWQEGALLSGELTPDAELSQVRLGRKWTKEVFSPFGPPSSAVELVNVEVVDQDTIRFDGNLEETLRIEYRSASSTGVSSRNSLKAEVWVAKGGRVLRQDVHLMNTTFRFTRLSNEEAIQKANDFLDLDRFATIQPTELAP